MPIYEYECNECGSRFERKQNISDDPIQNCPQCPGLVRRLIQRVGLVFKGNGFYVTDNRKSAYASEEKKSIPVSGASVEKKSTPASSTSEEKKSTPTSGAKGD